MTREPSILLADDDDVGRYVIATMLRRSGFTVREVADGLSAVAAVLADPPDIAVLDVKMPGLDGFEACRRIKSHEDTRHIPVLMLSATFMETEAKVEGLETGADAYLTQPVEAPVLAATIRSMLRARSLEAEVRSAATEWRTTFDAISDAVAVLDPDGVVVRANPAFEAVFGSDAVGTRVEALEVGRSSGELELENRTHSVRVDVVPGSQRLVVTLSDVTAARRTERERAAALAREQTISRTLQQTLLPERLPSDERLAVHAWHLAAEQELIVGGDWYDVIETRNGVWLVIGDVAGHGVAAAAQAGQLRHSLRVYAHEGFGLAESVRRLNELVTDTELTDMATMCIVAITHDDDEVRVVSAGHPPPVLVPAAGPPRLAVEGHGVVLGVVGASYAESTFAFEAGDRLMLYTDGLVERPGELIDDAIDRLVTECATVDGLEALRAHVVERLVGDTHPRDDVALLLAQRCVL
ncbi:SpoIIE family protein phosphatase [Solirubrobacter sp. CPCC 204708]|uniref:SpoIIE family protein phosphatase n=1 Tax=Solirubrobacter deserti TaxID=2282478 RepID=A0ABT4RCT4_9ACTN|nr:SpoIIE family protein phosphatase [Solirubrobacter deserti]MBE2315567.1 SpoIIE family protein phosphatase [Solirubrobacter deserti]MDA0136206.1 SpoIIE family protein phosphatase [Solirubrobacter deserti]